MKDVEESELEDEIRDLEINQSIISENAHYLYNRCVTIIAATTTQTEFMYIFPEHLKKALQIQSKQLPRINHIKRCCLEISLNASNMLQNPQARAYNLQTPKDRNRIRKRLYKWRKDTNTYKKYIENREWLL